MSGHDVDKHRTSGTGPRIRRRRKQTRFSRFHRACFGIVLFAVAGLVAIRGQQDSSAQTLAPPDNTEDGLSLQKRAAGNVQTTMASRRGKGMPSGLAASAPARERAESFIGAYATSFGLRGAIDVILKQASARDEVGMEHLRYQQVFQGIPVTGGEILIHLNGDRVVAANSELLIDPRIDTNPVLDSTQAVQVARVLIQRLKREAPSFSQPRLEVFNRGILDEGIYPTRLSWFVEATTSDAREFIWIDARSGWVLLHFNQVTRALRREIYTADSGPTLPGRLMRTEGEPPTGDIDADLAYQYSGDTYLYFLNQHGRDSFDGSGGKLISTVHACPANESCPWPNAHWDGVQMAYGTGFARADDVDAHELTHALTQHTANLLYYMQSGALNESYSDIFGETVDLKNGRGNDAPSVRWQLGEDLPGGAIRDMRNPWRFWNPGKVSDPQWQHDPSQDGGGVHTNSGVPNLAYALMVDGGSFNGQIVTGIGLDTAAKIQYRALTIYLTSGANLLDNYNALLQSCQDLLGVAGITSNTCVQVERALDAVEMNHVVPLNSPVPAFCPSGQSIATLFEDNFESSPASRWTTRALRGTGTWIIQDINWAKSGIHMAWGEDFDQVGDAVLEMSAGLTLPPGARLQFNHAYAFEEDFFAAYDGAVIEYSTDGNTWIDAGSLITGGDPYDPRGVIDRYSGNPLAGRRGFLGNSYGYTASQLNLSSLANRNVRFRFRVGTDEAVGNIGWVIDDVRVYTCQTSTCSYSVSPASVSVGAGGGPAVLQISATEPSCSWQASSPVSWIRLPSSGGSGSRTLEITVDPNPGPSPRTATLTVAGRLVAVSQSGINSSPDPVAIYRNVNGQITAVTYAAVGAAVSAGGGPMASEPAVSQDSAGNTHVVARDTFNGLWLTAFRSGTRDWAAWRALGGVTVGQPDIAASATGDVYVAARDAGNGYYLVIAPTGGSSVQWKYLGGVLASDPSISVGTQGYVSIAGRDSFGAVWLCRYRIADGRAEWRLLGGVTLGRPVIREGPDQVVYVVVRDTLGSLWKATVGAAGIPNWSWGQGVSAVDPQLAYDGSGQYWILIRDQLGTPYVRSFAPGSAGAWGAYAYPGGSLPNGASIAGAAGEFFLAGRGSNGKLYWYRSSLNAWRDAGIDVQAGGVPSAAPR